ncbi:MAG: secondary thiamine-phosphate synthase enzyme YjbQ [Sumerlaeia bacterium]
MVTVLRFQTRRQGLLEITREVQQLVQNSTCAEGLCTVMIQHTSASLMIQENADPSAKHDLEKWLNRLVPENDPHFTHTSEGPDDMPSHIKAALTLTSISIPILNSKLCLGTWQGLYLWEHRKAPHQRNVVVHIS